MIEELGRNLLTVEDAYRDRVGHGHLQVRSVVADEELSRWALVKAMDGLAQLTAAEWRPENKALQTDRASQLSLLQRGG